MNKQTGQAVAQYQESTQKHAGATTPHSVDIEAGNSKLLQHHFTRQLRIEPRRKHSDQKHQDATNKLQIEYARLTYAEPNT